MLVDYRLIQPQEETALFALWSEVFPGTEPARWRQQFIWDPDRFQRTFVAVAGDGAILATVRYLLRTIQAGQGQTLRMGWLTNVATRPAVQRQGHAGQLLALTSTAMQQAGCHCSLLSADEEVAPFYEQYGWCRYPYPYRQGLLSGVQLAPAGAYQCHPFDPAQEPDGWQRLAAVYAHANQQHPLTVVRDQDYWQTYIAMRYQDWVTYAGAEILAALRPGETSALSGYAIVHFSEMGVLLSELCVQPDEPAAMAALLNAITAELQRRHLPHQGRVHLPHEPAIDAALAQFFTHTLHEAHDAYLLARPLGTGLTANQLAALLTSPTAHFWLIDEY
jgi:predicted N-acetyltransferase YhbS